MNVWILVFYMAGYQSGGPAIIDNIATQQECERLKKIVLEFKLRTSEAAISCIEVRKAK